MSIVLYWSQKTEVRYKKSTNERDNLLTSMSTDVRLDKVTPEAELIASPDSPVSLFFFLTLSLPAKVVDADDREKKRIFFIQILL